MGRLFLNLRPREILDFLVGRRTAQGGILQEFLEPRLLDDTLIGFPFDKLKSLHLPRGHPGVEDNFQTKRREVDVPGLNQRIQERHAVFLRQVEGVRIQELEHDHAHFLIVAYEAQVQTGKKRSELQVGPDGRPLAHRE